MILADALLPPKPPGQQHGEWWLPLSEVTESRTVPAPLDQLPLLVWFPDRMVPGGVKAVDPLEPSPGGPRVLAAELAITSEPVTDGVVFAALPWLADYRRRDLYLSGPSRGPVTGPNRVERTGRVSEIVHSYHLKGGQVGNRELR